MKKQKSVLIVDDDPDIVELLSYNLKRRGYTVTTSASGLNAIWEIEGGKLPDLVLLDLMMPSPDGYDLCRFLKGCDDFRKVPLVIISAKGTPEDLQKGLEMGADAYLPKPFSIGSLM